MTRSRDEPTHGEIGASTVEYGVMRARTTGYVRLGEDSGFWLSVAGAEGAGRDFYFPEYVANPTDPAAERGANGLPIDGNARGVDGFTAGMVTGRFWYHAFTLQWMLNSRNKTIPTAEYGAIFGDARSHFADTRGMLEAKFEPRLSPAVQSVSRAHANLYDFDGETAYEAPAGANRDTYRGRWFGLEQRFVYTPVDTVRATIGGEVIRHVQTKQVGEADSGPYVFDNHGNPGRNDPFTVAAGYGLADVALTRAVKLSGGARLDYYSNLDTFDVAAAVNPRLALLVKPHEHGNLKIMGGKAFRAPSVYELHYTSPTQQPSVDLRPEQIYSGEVEYSHRLGATVMATVAGYTNYVSRLIELADLPGGRTQYVNSASPVLVVGGEAEIRREWKAGWMVGATYSQQHARYLGDTGRRDVPNSPVHLASVKGAVPIVGRSLAAMTRLTFEGPRPDRNVAPTDPPQGTTDAGVVWDIVLHGEAERLGVRYNLGVYNVADWKYDIVPSGEFRQRTIVQSGRTALASVSVAF